MGVLNLSDKRQSINHAELWGTTEDGQHFYMRFRSGTLEVKTAEKFDDPEEEFISDGGAKSVYEREYEESYYPEVKKQYENWNEVLEVTPYVFKNRVTF